METKEKIINSEIFDKMLLGGVENLHSNIQVVNDLNVFPIPDGDTGENMFSTLKSGFDKLKVSKGISLCEKARALADGMLLGARGNSGVILSQLFFGLAEGLAGKENADLKEFSNALLEGVKCAYGSVSHPVEGTILTVARESAEKVSESLLNDMTVEEFFDVFSQEMKKSLEHTPELLKVLKEAGVIDSGGAGLYYIIEGFCLALGGKVSLGELNTTYSDDKPAVDYSAFNENSEMKFGYCTELLLQLLNKKCDVNSFDLESFKDYLNSIGDSVVAFRTGTVVKIHVHTLNPNLVLERALQFGDFLTVKIENMTLQHNETLSEDKKNEKQERKKFALVTVASGEGLVKLFKELGADFVINGGQTNNPSSEDFINAFESVNADYIFVLPNNGNIVLTAKQAASIYKDASVRVIESKSEGEGYSALSMLDYSSDDPDTIENNLKEDMKDVQSAMVARSVRDACLNGVSVKEGQYMGYSNGQLLVAKNDKTDACCALIDCIDKTDKYCIIAVYGKSVSEQEKYILSTFVKQNYPDIEFYEIAGLQDVHDFLIFIQ